MYNFGHGDAHQVVKEQPVTEAANHGPDALPLGERDHDGDGNVVRNEIGYSGQREAQQFAFRNVFSQGL